MWGGGLIKESTEARKVKNEVIRLLRKKGHKVYDCTCKDGTSQRDVLKRIVTMCNRHKVDLDVSIHFNAGQMTRVETERQRERKCLCTVDRVQQKRRRSALFGQLRHLDFRIGE